MIKNTLITLSTLTLLVSSVDARDNPFEATQTYKEQKTRTIPILGHDEEKSIVPEQKKIIEKEIVETKAAEPIIKKELVAKKINKKPLEEIVFKDPIKPIEIKTYKYNLLSFVDMHITGDIMNISTVYKLKKYFILKEENKLVFDFVAKHNFYTQREVVSTHQDFEKITIGAHPKKSFFRVVIKVTNKLSNYKVDIDKKGLITIECIRK